jgi:hypothetical protein
MCLVVEPGYQFSTGWNTLQSHEKKNKLSQTASRGIRIVAREEEKANVLIYHVYVLLLHLGIIF